jgi:hypothetical protein
LYVFVFFFWPSLVCVEGRYELYQLNLPRSETSLLHSPRIKSIYTGDYPRWLSGTDIGIDETDLWRHVKDTLNVGCSVSP